MVLQGRQSFLNAVERATSITCPLLTIVPKLYRDFDKPAFLNESGHLAYPARAPSLGTVLFNAVLRARYWDVNDWDVNDPDLNQASSHRGEFGSG